MVNPVSLQEDLARFINKNGEPVQIQYWQVSHNSGSYDEGFLQQSGASVWVKGSVQPVGMKNSEELSLLQQGFISLSDKKIYFVGSVDFYPNNGISHVKLGLLTGSPNITYYTLLGDGVQNSTSVSGVVVYDKVFCRKLNAGSFVNQI